MPPRPPHRRRSPRQAAPRSKLLGRTALPGCYACTPVLPCRSAATGPFPDMHDARRPGPSTRDSTRIIQCKRRLAAWLRVTGCRVANHGPAPLSRPRSPCRRATCNHLTPCIARCQDLLRAGQYMTWVQVGSATVSEFLVWKNTSSGVRKPSRFRGQEATAGPRAGGYSPTGVPRERRGPPGAEARSGCRLPRPRSSYDVPRGPGGDELRGRLQRFPFDWRVGQATIRPQLAHRARQRSCTSKLNSPNFIGGTENGDGEYVGEVYRSRAD